MTEAKTSAETPSATLKTLPINATIQRLLQLIGYVRSGYVTRLSVVATTADNQVIAEELMTHENDLFCWRKS